VRRSRVVIPLVLVLGAMLAGCTDDDDPGPAQPTTAPQGGKVSLTLGVWGSEREVEAYQRVVDGYNATTEEASVRVKSYPTHDELLAALDGGKVPDVFLMTRNDLPTLRAQELIQPIGNLLDERDVDFGDGYSRPALEAFAGDRDLQCMPYGVSPMVIYYNRTLVDFTRMEERELDVPNVDDEDLTRKPSWNLEQFQAAADFASRPRRGIAGFYVAPTLRGLAPFIYSGGGQLFNDDDPPTSLAFSSDATRGALEEVLPVLRDPTLTLSPEQLAEKSPLEWFKEGKLGMIAGFRDLVPELRATSGLDFDVMPMPTVDESATIGELTGVCLAQDTRNVAEAADFLVHLVSTESVASVAASGYLAPANTEVALSDAFLQPGRPPLHSIVFVSSVKNMRIPPLISNVAGLEAAVAEPLRAMLEVEIPDLDALTTQIDEASQAVLAPPEEEESESPGDEDS